MKLGKKILIACIAVVLFFVAEYALYYVFHYVLYDDYKDCLSSYTTETATEYKAIGTGSGDLADYDLIAENDTLQLYAQPATGYIAVYDKATGETSYSNPANADEDTVANDTNKGILKSQMVIKYFNTSRTEGTYSSYDYTIAISASQLTVESIENGVRFNYDIKPKSTSVQVIPFVMTAERFDQFVSKMSDKTAKKIKKYYDLSEDGTTYTLIAGIREGSGTTMQADQVKKAFYDEAGYTEDDYMIDMADSGYEIEMPPSFKVSMEYRLDGDSLVVNIPTSLIEEYNGSISNIEVLPAFGAASKEESGYIVVPNGSGSLVYFNNGKITTADYSSYIYGIDPLAADYTVVENSTQARLPLFALCRENSTILAVIEDGTSLAAVKSVVSDRVNNYNTADFSFTLRGSEKLDMFGTSGNAASIPIVESECYDCNIQIRYSFLGSDYTGYSGVANYYREKLIADGKLTELGDNTSNAASDIGLYYDLIGAVKVTDFIVGVQYLAVQPMTTYAQATEIVNIFKDAGISNQIVNYQGWFNGGYYHDVTSKLKLVKKLGSQKDFEGLATLLESYGGKLYGDVAFQKVTYISKRYNDFYESCRYYAGYAGTLGQVSPTTLRQTASLGYEENLYSLVSPKYLVRYVDQFLKKMNGIDITGISLRDLGDTLASDKKRTEVIDREAALDVVNAQLQKIADSGKDVMVSGGNDYAVTYADDLINVPTGDNAYYGIDEEIPLYEMIYHGTVNYASEAINLSDNYDVDDITLRLIEYGASPHFTFTYTEANDMKYTGLNSKYSTTFANWKDTAVTVYNNVNGALKYVKNANIVKHEIIDTGLKKVTYSNGVIFYINETDTDATIDGVSVAAMSYEIGGLD